MLIIEPNVHREDPILSIIALVNGRSSQTKELRPGVYQIGHFGGSHFMPDYEDYPEFDGNRGPYGVCDSVEQLLCRYPELALPGREFVVTITPVRRADQPECDGWRWHKWGDYIGTQEPRHEYLFDETHIEEVLVFHIYEKK